MHAGPGDIHTLFPTTHMHFSNIYTPIPTYHSPQIQQQQQTNNHTSFTYLSSDVHSKGGPLSVSLAVVCPYITANVNASTDVGIPVAIALGVVIFLTGIAYGIRQVNTHAPSDQCYDSP